MEEFLLGFNLNGNETKKRERRIIKFWMSAGVGEPVK